MMEKSKKSTKKRNPMLIVTIFMWFLCICALFFYVSSMKNTSHYNSDDVIIHEHGSIIGEGEKTFYVYIIDEALEEDIAHLEVRTDKEYLLEALLDYHLIEGEETEYGFLIKTINGIRADYDLDRVYWAFYINGAYSIKTVDLINVKNNDVYTFCIEK